MRPIILHGPARKNGPDYRLKTYWRRRETEESGVDLSLKRPTLGSRMVEDKTSHSALLNSVSYCHNTVIIHFTLSHAVLLSSLLFHVYCIVYPIVLDSIVLHSILYYAPCSLIMVGTFAYLP